MEGSGRELKLKKGNRVLSTYGMGTVTWASTYCATVVIDADGITRTFGLSELDLLEGQLDKEVTEKVDVWQALNFIHQLRARGDEPGHMMADLLEPLAEAYKALRESHG